MPIMQPKVFIVSIIGILVLALGFWAYSNWERYSNTYEPYRLYAME